MNRNYVAIAVSLTVAVTLTLLAIIRLQGNRQSVANQITTTASPSAFSQQETPSPTPPHVPEVVLPPELTAKLPEADQRNVAKILQTFKAPISFYGKVNDEKGQPIADARVHYSAADQYFGDSSKYEGVSDENGLFSITGIKGAGLYVTVAKDGYYETTESGTGFGYGVPSGKPPPTKENPAVFVLRRKGHSEPLVTVNSRQYKVPKDGTAFEIDLRTGQQVPINNGDLVFERWMDAQKDAAGRFDWKCRMTVPGGGALQRGGEFDFQAPAGGYERSIEIDMPRTLGEKWQRIKTLDYFLKLKDGSFARATLTMYAGHDNFLVLDSYVNPKPGSRNLEYDPNKRINK